MAACASLSFVPVTAEDQLDAWPWETSRLFAVTPAYSPVRKAMRTTSTARGTRAGSAGEEATAAAARRPVQSPTAHVLEAPLDWLYTFSAYLKKF